MSRPPPPPASSGAAVLLMLTLGGLVAVAAWLVVLGISWAFVRRTESHRQTFEWFKQEMARPAEHEHPSR